MKEDRFGNEKRGNGELKRSEDKDEESDRDSNAGEWQMKRLG